MRKVKSRSHAHSHSRKPNHHELPLSKNTMTHIALGAAAGCAIGAVAAILIAPKQRKHKFTQKLDEFYDHVTDTAEDYAHDALDKGQKAYQACRDAAGNIYSAASGTLAKNSNRNIVLGAICAGLIGATAIYTLSQKKSSHQSFAERWGTSKWSNMAKCVVDAVSSKLHEQEEEHDEHRNPIQNAMDWAEIGLNLWQEFKKRR